MLHRPRLMRVLVMLALFSSLMLMHGAGIVDAQGGGNGNGGHNNGRRVGQSERNDTSGPLREMPVNNEQPPAEPIDFAGGLEAPPPPPPAAPKAPGQRGDGADANKILVAMPTPVANWDGTPNSNASYPPDPVGDVGPNHYVAVVNFHYHVFDRNGQSLLGPLDTRTIWSGFGAPCETRNDGDGIVLYDQYADRWLIAQMVSTSPYGQCIAISTTGDPTGSFHRYFINQSATEFYDYPKYGVWHDGYYLTANRYTGCPSACSFVGTAAIVLNRNAMLNGQTATFQEFQVTGYGTMLPSDADGPTMPSPGTPAYIANINSSSLSIWTFATNWATPANTQFLGPTALPVAYFEYLCPGTRNCIPQPGTAVGLDDKDDRLMYRLAYRKFYSHESLVVTHNVNMLVPPSIRAAMRWYEVRVNGTNVSLYQQGTYSPDAVNRWMGSIVMDKAGNIGLGYNVSDATSVYPGIRYAGRLSTDTLGQMPFDEGVIVNGAGVQTGTAYRWGDYSMIAVDPTDDCTFWYTNQYMPVTGVTAWTTRVGQFRFPSCTTATAPGAPSNTAVSQTGNGLTVSWAAPASNGGSAIVGYRVYRGTQANNMPFLTSVGNVTSYLDTAVTPGTTYYYEITAINALGESQPSPDASAPYQGATAPGAPQNLAATGGSAQVSLTWQAPASDGGAAITNYKVYRGTTSNNLSLLTTLGNGLNYTDTGLTNGTTYYYKVSAVNSAGEGAQSAGANATPQQTTPGAPQSLAAAGANTQVTLNWQAPTSSGTSPITAYKVYRGTTSTNLPLLTTLGNVLTYVNTGLTNGTTYYYKVTAVNASGESAASNTASAIPSAPTVPGAPQNFTATPGDKLVTLTWTPPVSDGNSPITNYLVYRGAKSTSQSLVATLGPDVTSYINTGLTAGTTYYFKIAAKNAVGTGAFTAVLSAKPFALTVPGVPTTVTTASCNASVNVNWGPPTSDGGTPITAYNIYRGTSSSATPLLATVGPDSRTYPDTAVTNGVTYYYKVAAVNAKGTGALSAAVSALPKLPTVPDAPTGLTATGGDAKVTLSWTAPTNTGGCIPITGYKIYRGLASNAMSVIATLGNVTSYLDTTVTNNTLYYYKVSALNQVVGEGAASSTVSTTPKPPTVPTTPQTVKATGLAPGIKLTWVAPTSNGGDPITAYRIYRGTSSASQTFLIEVGNVLLYQDTGAVKGTRYYYKMTAKNGVGESPFSAIVNTTARKAGGENASDGVEPAETEEVVAEFEVEIPADATEVAPEPDQSGANK